MEGRLRVELDLQLKRWAGTVWKGRSGVINVALPRAGKWIEVKKVKIPPEMQWAGTLWRAQMWPGGTEFVGSEWEVLTWVAKKCD